MILKSHLVESFTNGSCKFLKEAVSLFFGERQFVENADVFFRMLKAKTKIFEFCFYLVQSETIG